MLMRPIEMSHLDEVNSEFWKKKMPLKQKGSYGNIAVIPK
jgi:hypothetical protein